MLSQKELLQLMALQGKLSWEINAQNRTPEELLLELRAAFEQLAESGASGSVAQALATLEEELKVMTSAVSLKDYNDARFSFSESSTWLEMLETKFNKQRPARVFFSGSSEDLDRIIASDISALVGKGDSVMQADISAMLAELDASDAATGEQQAVISEIRRSTETALSELAEVVAVL